MLDSRISVDDFRSKILADLTPLPVNRLPLLESLGLPVVADVVAQGAYPAFDHAAVDGYAVAWSDVSASSGAHQVTLPVVGENLAGAATLLALSPGTAVRISAGAKIPVGADTVVATNLTDKGVAAVRIVTAPLRLGDGVRRTGEGWLSDEVLLAAGTVVEPRHLAVLAAAGFASVPARPKPRVVIVSTGRELREPGQAAVSEAIFDANSFLLAAAVQRAGAIAYRVGAAPDEPGAFDEAIDDQLVRADLVITTGGTSEGEADVVRQVMTRRGLWCGSVMAHPGGGHGFGVLGPDQTPWVALPGDPVAAWISFHTSVMPAIRHLQGLPDEPVEYAGLVTPIQMLGTGPQYLLGTLETAVTEAGDEVSAFIPLADPVGLHRLGDVARATHIAVIPRGVGTAASGREIEVVRCA